jgi:Peptidase family M23
MSRRRNFVQCAANGRNFALAATLLSACAVVAPGALASGPPQDALAAGSPAAPMLKLYTRIFEPGELVRIDAQRNDCRVVSATGMFLGRTITFAPSSRPYPLPRFEGWAVVPLDQKPGVQRISVTMRCGADIPEMTVERDVSIADKNFPEQRLTVKAAFVNPPKNAMARIARERKITSAIYAKRTPLPLPVEPFVKPVPGDSTSVFGARRILNGQPKDPHPGIDLSAPTGTTVHASGPGVVALAADLYYSGGTVILDHGDGLFTIYAHLSSIGAKEGQRVDAGDAIGLSGATGRVTGPHLHWGARLGDLIFDPRSLLDSRLFR